MSGKAMPGTFLASLMAPNHGCDNHMPLTNLITPEAIFASLKVNTKKQALQELSERAAAVSGLSAREIFDALLQRERLGSTGFGNGVAVPHGKLAKAERISASSRGSNGRSISRRSTVFPSTSSSC